VLASTDAIMPIVRAYDSFARMGISGKVFGKVTVPDYGILFASFSVSHPFSWVGK
jgi:hypothetical protein